MPSKNQKAICEQLEGSVYYRLQDIESLPESEQLLVERLGRHAVLDVVEVQLEAGFPFTVDLISEFTQLKKLKIIGIDPIEKGYESIFGFLELEELIFERTSLDDLAGFGALKQLRKFGLYELTRGQQGAEVFGSLEFLTTLHLNDSPVDQIQLDGIATSQSIEDLSFSVTVGQLDLAPLAQMKQLKFIQIRRAKTSEFDTTVFLELKNLKELKIWPEMKTNDPVMLELEERGVRVDA